MTHFLKITPRHFADVRCRRKKAELRLDDRNFKCGDSVQLQEWARGRYTGREILLLITHVLRDVDFPQGLQNGFCMFSFDLLATPEASAQ